MFTKNATYLHNIDFKRSWDLVIISIHIVSIYNYIAQLTEVNDVKESAMSRMHTEDITAKNTYVVESIVGQGRINVYSLTIPLGF